jgi:hypothetical protein
MSELLIRLNIGREMSWLEDSKIDNFSIIASSTIVESFPKKLTTALLKIGKPYIIDPFTHIFGYEVKDMSEKRWFPKLMHAYGLDYIIPPDKNTIPLSKLLDTKKQPTKDLKSFVENVMVYQRTAIQDVYDEISEFEEFEGQSEHTALSPKCILAPYFYLGYDSEDWKKVNIHCIKSAISMKQNKEKIYAVILIDKIILGISADIDEIIKDYNIEGVDGYFIWITDFNEKTARETELQAFIRLIEQLSKFKKPIYNMYGGLFSFLLHAKGMTGACHSICYGEHKDPFLIGGMLANVRYYQCDIRAKIPYSKIHEIEKTLELTKCGCEYCNELPKVRDNIGKQMELCGKHFLLMRVKEITDINVATSKVLTNMREVYEKSKTYDRILAYRHFYEQLDTWNRAFGYDSVL